MQKFPVKLLWLPVLIIIVTYISFYPSLNCGFVNWDDHLMVSENDLVVSNTLRLKDIFTTPVANLYHPITTLSLALNYQAGKLDPSGYHSWNVCLHLFNTLFVFIFIYVLTGCKWRVAAIVSMLFGIHPMHVESVTWVTERKDLLFMFFFLPGLITYLYYRKTQQSLWYAFTLLLFLLSLLSKPHAVVFPVILLLIDYFLKEKWRARLLIEKLPFFITALAFSLITYHIMQGRATWNSLAPMFSPLQMVCFTSYGIIMYLVKLFWPFNLSALYPYLLGTNGRLPFYIYLCPLALSAFMAVVYFLLRKKPVVVFGLLFFLASIAPVLQIVPNNSAVIADRYSYLSYLGLFFIPAWYINALWENEAGKFKYLKIPAMAILSLFLTMCCFLTFQQCKVWHDSITLWDHAVKCDSKNAMAYNNLGNAYRLQRKLDLAITDYTMAINLNPKYAEPYANRGLAYWDQRKPELAIADYDTAISLLPHYDVPYYSRGIVYSNQGKTALAIADFNKAISINPKCVQAYNSRGFTYWNIEKPELAIADYNAAISINPLFDVAYYNRGIVYANQGKTEQAIADFSTVINLSPKLDVAYYNRGISYAKQGEIELAIADFNTAIILNPKYVQAYNSRGLAFWNQRKPELAIADYDSAIILNPKFDLAYFNRGNAYAGEGKPEPAIADYNQAISINPQYVKAYMKRGNAYAAVGKLELAIADFTTAMGLNPQYAQAYNNRGMAEEQKGDIAQAKKDFQKAKELGWVSAR